MAANAAESAYDGRKIEQYFPTHDKADGYQNHWQFYPPRAALEPHEKLMMAVLEEAIKRYDFLSHHKLFPRQERELCELKRWFKSAEDDYFLSFRVICDHFHFSVSKLSDMVLNHISEIMVTFTSKGMHKVALSDLGKNGNVRMG